MILRQATDEDSYFFLHLRNDRVSVLMSHRPPLSLEEHAKWWATTTDDRWVAEEGGKPVGTVRVSADGEVSIVVAPEERDRGYGTEMLEQLVVAPHTRLIAEVLPENLASQRAFLKAGWVPILFEKRK